MQPAKGNEKNEHPELTLLSPLDLWLISSIRSQSQKPWDLTDVIKISPSFKAWDSLGKFWKFDLEGQTEDIWHYL